MAMNIVFYRGYQIYHKNCEYYFAVRSVDKRNNSKKVYVSRNLFTIHKLIDEMIEYQVIGKEYDSMCLGEERINTSLNWIKQL